MTVSSTVSTVNQEQQQTRKYQESINGKHDLISVHAHVLWTACKAWFDFCWFMILYIYQAFVMNWQFVHSEPPAVAQCQQGEMPAPQRGCKE